MQKTLIIDNKNVVLACNAATPLKYKKQFNRDLFADMARLGVLEEVFDKKTQSFNIEKLDLMDMEIFYNMTWILAKTANEKIPEPIKWLERFEEFPLEEIIPEVIEMLNRTMAGKKKSKMHTNMKKPRR